MFKTGYTEKDVLLFCLFLTLDNADNLPSSRMANGVLGIVAMLSSFLKKILELDGFDEENYA
jgi:hypothetical protein